MLKLREIELLGFKSFADRTRLVCDGSTTAVVGPNGCGKSNLADAVSWVLGEQSARMLRGERMSDVIFNGTGSRPPTGLAEVTVTLAEIETESEMGGGEAGDNAAFPPGANGNGISSTMRRLPTSELKVTRRLFRSGESEYLLNGETCRLRDIQDIFMGTGLGPDSYAIIEQGRIGQILSSKPSDRRAIIEEAAGVSKFKSRKRLAEAKLESSRQNLARINDILDEILKQVNSLKRQASKAAKCRELQQEARSCQKRVYASQWLTMDAECRKLREAFQASQQECSESARRLEEIESSRSHVAARHEQLEEELKRLHESLARSELEGERLRSRAESLRQQAQDLEARSAEADREKNLVQEQSEFLGRTALDQARQARQLEEEWTVAQEAAKKFAARHEHETHEIRRGELELEGRRRQALQAVNHAANLRSQAGQAEEMAASVERQIARLLSERGAVEVEHARISADLEALEQQHAQHEGALSALAKSVSETEMSLEQARQDEAALREQVSSLNQNLSLASARRQALEESLARHSYATDGVRRLLSRTGGENGFHPLGTVADFIEVAPGYEEIVEEFLKAELGGVVVEGPQEARSGISLLQSDGGGRSTFFIRRFSSNGHGHELNSSGVVDARKQPGVVASLQELVRVEPRLGLNGDLAFPVLADSYIVEDSACAERLAGAYPSSHFLTPQGEHYHHRLVSGGKAASAGPLLLRRDFRESERRTFELRELLKGAQEQWAASQKRVESLTLQLRNFAGEQVRAEKESMVAHEKLRQARETKDRAASQIQIFDKESILIEEEKQRIEQRRGALRQELDTAQQEQDQSEKRMAEADDFLRLLRSKLDDLTRELTEAQVKSSALEERWRAAEADCSRVTAEAAKAGEKLAKLVSQSQLWDGEARRLRAEAGDAEAQLREAAAASESLRSRLAARDEESRAARAQRDQTNAQQEALRAELDAQREKRTASEVAHARAESDLNHLIQQCREELNEDPASLVAQAAPEDLLGGEKLQAAEEELGDFKARLERLGPVNMMALEELQEAEQRLTFLDTQRQDLLASISDTTQTIREIDEASNRKFSEAFKAINGFFAESFRTLFGGGAGEMQATDENDRESGIDLVVQPPGKRLQNVLLLSGGEKALTALALLIAVFRYTPSPFCILDEVDAPLDDSNIGRFTRMIRTMSSQTQWILITHNKRTMEACHLMYGVTMEEAGVSKLISVRLESMAPQRLAVPA